jgi:hypothetical protein
VEFTDDGLVTRNTIRLTELRDWPGIGTGADEVLSQFATERLITLSSETAQISQTALIAAWPRLKEWVKTSSAQPPDNSPSGLLLRIYVPSGRLYATETEKALSLFHDWLSRVRGYGIRQAGYQTAAGSMFEFVANQGFAGVDLPREIADFSDFLDLCAKEFSSSCAGQCIDFRHTSVLYSAESDVSS